MIAGTIFMVLAFLSWRKGELTDKQLLVEVTFCFFVFMLTMIYHLSRMNRRSNEEAVRRTATRATVLAAAILLLVMASFAVFVFLP